MYTHILGLRELEIHWRALSFEGKEKLELYLPNHLQVFHDLHDLECVERHAIFALGAWGKRGHL